MKFWLFGLALVIFLLPGDASASTAILPHVKIFDYQGTVKQEFPVFNSAYEGNMDVATIDLGSDGVDEVAITAGMDNKPSLTLWRADGSNIFDLAPYGDNFRGGAYVSSGDIDGDKTNEIVTSPGYRGGPHIRIFNGNSNSGNFFAFAKGETTGAKVLVADLGGDGIAEIIVGSNMGRKPEIVLYDSGGRKIKSAPLDMPGADGINLAKIDINGDGRQEILVAPAYGGRSEILILDQDLRVTGRFLANDENYKGGVNIASGDVNGDGKPEIIAGTGFGGPAKIKIFDVQGNFISEFTPFGEAYTGGVRMAVGNFGLDKNPQIVVVPERVYAESRMDRKYITVDLSKQTLYYWQNGYRLGRFLISSGLAKAPTPKGEFAIYLKRLNVRMTWYYGPNNPMNYDLPNVPWVSSFKGPYTIHGTYWHHNFGHPMSHGCINMFTPDAKLIYNWVEMGTPIIIY